MMQRFTVLLVSATVCCIAQGQWTTTLPVFLENAQVVDAQTLSNGEVIAVSVSFHRSNSNRLTRANSWITRISSSGEILYTSPIQDGVKCIKAVSISKGNSSHPYQLMTLTWDSLTQQSRSVGQFQMNNAGEVGPANHHLVLDGTRQFQFFDPALDQDSALFIAGGVAYDTLNSVPNRILLMRIGTDGTELGQTILDTTSEITFGKHSMLSGSLMMTSVYGGSIGPFGVTKYLQFNQELEYVGGFPGTCVSGNGNVFPPDSVLRDGLFMTTLPSGSFIVSGRIGTMSTDEGMRFVATRNSSSGTQEANFMPPHETLYDFCAPLQSHDVTPDGSIVAAVLHNFNPWSSTAMSTIPSRIHIYKLDTMLNVLCDQVAVDGSEDGSYYMLNRVKATPDGGTLLMGSRMNVNTQSLPQPWIMKIAPWDCQSGIREQDVATAASVWPNPGSTGFTAFVNGPVVARGTLDLYNAQGQLAASTDVLQSSATVLATNLVPGVYLYRITDGTGALRATGRWVKE